MKNYKEKYKNIATIGLIFDVKNKSKPLSVDIEIALFGFGMSSLS